MTDNTDNTTTDNTTTGAVAAPLLPPLSRRRVCDTLENLDIAYTVTARGLVITRWADGSVAFDIVGEGNMFTARGQWRGVLPADRRTDLLETCNTWNTDRFQPKVYFYRDDEGMLRVAGEHTVDYRHGVTDEQLDEHVRSTVGTVGGLFEMLNEEYPEGRAEGGD